MSQSEFLKVWKEAGESTVVSIKTPAGQVDALIHDVQFEPVSGQPIHADFYVFEKGHKVEISIPLEFVGESPAVKAGGVLVKSLHELKIKADPSNIPHELAVDISTLLEIGNDIFAKDIKLPSGVELMENPEEVAVTVALAKEEPAEEAPMDLSAIEVEKKGKKEEEGEAPATE
jgi:large subunit ribosomal protein L25